MTQVFTGLEEVDFETLIAGIALYRPGSMDNVPNYQDRKNGLKPVTYPIPELKPVLENTEGVLIYQEQLMSMARMLGGYSMGESDLLRKAVGKKSEKVMNEELPKLHKSIMNNGYSKENADYVIDLIKPFVGYGFNKSHGAAYALIGFYTAYLKHFYPVEFYKAILTVFGDDENKLSAYIKDAKENGFQVLPPDLNQSEEDFTVVDDKTILFGLGSIKGLPAKAISSILEKRPFHTLPELIIKNTKGELNKTAVRALAYSGAVNGLTEETNRQAILNELFITRGDGADVQRPDEFTKKEMLEKERTLLGVYMSGHPLEDIAKPIDWEEAMNNHGRVETHAVVESIRRITTKKGDPMAFVSLNFLEKTMDAVMFPSLYEKEFQFKSNSKLLQIGPTIIEGMILKISARFQEDSRGELSFILNQASVPVRANSQLEEHIKTLEEDVGVEFKEPETIQAPVFKLNN